MSDLMLETIEAVEVTSPTQPVVVVESEIKCVEFHVPQPRIGGKLHKPVMTFWDRGEWADVYQKGGKRQFSVPKDAAPMIRFQLAALGWHVAAR